MDWSSHKTVFVYYWNCFQHFTESPVSITAPSTFISFESRLLTMLTIKLKKLSAETSHCYLHVKAIAN